MNSFCFVKLIEILENVSALLCAKYAKIRGKTDQQKVSAELLVSKQNQIRYLVNAVSHLN